MKCAFPLGVLFGLLMPGLSHAETDNLLWTSSGITYQPAKRWKLQGTQNFRFMENASRLESLMPQAEFEYSPYKWLDVGGGYRFIYESKKDDEMVSAHRYNADIQFAHKLGNFKLSYRLRYQEKHKSENLDIIMRLRNRFKLSYDTQTPYSPLLAMESFTGEDLNTRKTRLTMGVAAKLSKAHRLKVRYHHQTLIDVDERETERIFLLDYMYRIPKKKKKNKKEIGSEPDKPD